ncbi:MAG: hypothetical protein AAF528_00805 [Cyanobacteria bacterium P01_C01_bin.121]
MRTSNFILLEPVANQSNIYLMDGRWVAPEMVDYCNERNYDWIGLLQADREIELFRLSLPRVERLKCQQSCNLTISDLVKLTYQAPYQEIRVSQHIYWGYTCSLQVIGFGKVRFAVYFDNPQKKGSFMAFVTNRLDWSTSKILQHWMRHHAAPTLQISQKVLKIPHLKGLQAV